MLSNRTLRTTMAFTIAASLSTVAIADTKKQAPAAASAAAAENAPQMTIVEAVRDFGTLPKGQKIDAEFLIKNTGKTDLQILSVQPGCGCTVADFDKVIKPGATGKIRAAVDTATFTGAISKGVTVQTNDPNTPTAQLTIKALVQPYVEAHPVGYVRYNMIQGDTSSQSVVLFTEEEGTDFQVTSVETPGDWAKVTYTKIADEFGRVNAGRQGQAQWKIDVTYGGPTSNIGPINDKIRIMTNSRHQPEYILNVSGVVRPTYSVQPSILNFGEIAPADPASERKVILRSNNMAAPEAFQVTRVESSNPMVKASAKATSNPGEFQLDVTLAKNAKEGAIDGMLTIHTNDMVKPVFTLPIKGTIKPAATASN